MDSGLSALQAFFEARRALGEPVVLATVIATSGSTYRKAGARMLIGRDGGLAGLLSGGCLESDLYAEACAALEQRGARVKEYDSRTSDDPIWGLGLGCEGVMRILLQPATAAVRYDPLPRLFERAALPERSAFATVVASSEAGWPLGRCWLPDDSDDSPVARELAARCAAARRGEGANQIARLTAAPSIETFIGLLEPPVRLLLLGGGPDALAVVNQAALLGWSVTVIDHRPAFADALRSGGNARVVLSQPQEVAEHLRVDEFDAAVVMSHYLPADLAYLRHLARSTIRYVGLLGPAARRERLRADLGDAAALLEGRIFGPVGLDIGAQTPEAIALAIVAEIHAALSGREGRSYSLTAG
jgi:xanthine dehydrogenase accessory factor